MQLDPKHHKNVDITWGMNLFSDELDSRTTVERAGSRPEFVDKFIPDEDVARCFGGRILYRITDSGTSANLIAIADASGLGSTLYGVGSYGGYTGKMNLISTLSDAESSGAQPRDPAIGDHLLALPYMTKAAVGTDAADLFEDDCIKGFQIKLAGLHLRGTPCKVVFFELVLSGNGMRLSPKFCRRFEAICGASNIAMVVDECMTAGRCSISDNSCLLCDTYGLKPHFVTLGKEFGAGLVLYDRSRMSLQGANERWSSTYASRTTVRSVGKAIDIMNTLKESKAPYPDLVEETVRAKLGPENVVGFGLMLYISDKYAIKNPAPKGQCTKRTGLRIHERVFLYI